MLVCDDGVVVIPCNTCMKFMSLKAPGQQQRPSAWQVCAGTCERAWFHALPLPQDACVGDVMHSECSNVAHTFGYPPPASCTWWSSPPVLLSALPAASGTVRRWPENCKEWVTVTANDTLYLPELAHFALGGCIKLGILALQLVHQVRACLLGGCMVKLVGFTLRTCSNSCAMRLRSPSTDCTSFWGVYTCLSVGAQVHGSAP